MASTARRSTQKLRPLQPKYLKIGNASFNIEEIRKMKKADFIKRYKGQLNTDVEDAYYKITGKARPPVKEELS
jgi:hypothetical protein